VTAHTVGWIVLAIAGTVALTVDISIGVRRSSGRLRDSVIATIGWTLMGLAFGAVVAASAGTGDAGKYLTIFVLEKTLSLDNVAVFAVVLSAFAITEDRRQRVLISGILVALALRIALVSGGLALVDAVHDILIGFGVILLVAGGRMVRGHGGGDGPPRLVSWLTARRVTPAAAALVTIGVADLVFAVDSVPAAFAISRTAYVVVAANVFAVLGLRPLYDVLAVAMERLAYLDRAIGVLLCIIGVALCIEPFHPVPEWILLVAVIGTIAVGVIASLRVAPRSLPSVDRGEKDS
jgi:tellurite resistance protein TerC